MSLDSWLALYVSQMTEFLMGTWFLLSALPYSAIGYRDLLVVYNVPGACLKQQDEVVRFSP